MSDVSQILEALTSWGRSKLVEAWAQHYGCPPPPRLSQATLRLGVAYASQATVLGDLSPRHARHLDRLIARRGTNMRDPAPAMAHLAPGVRLMREWKGRTKIVEITADGFCWNDRVFRSLSAVARAITGTRWSGPRFFGLDSR